VTDRKRDLREVPLAKRRPLPRSLPEYERANPDRDQAIQAAYASGGYTMREIGDYFGLSQSRISKIIRPAPQLGSRTKA
jgi:DNA-directed RNA polymerase specialized sigma subunit